MQRRDFLKTAAAVGFVPASAAELMNTEPMPEPVEIPRFQAGVLLHTWIRLLGRKRCCYDHQCPCDPMPDWTTDDTVFLVRKGLDADGLWAMVLLRLRCRECGHQHIGQVSTSRDPLTSMANVSPDQDRFAIQIPDSCENLLAEVKPVML